MENKGKIIKNNMNTNNIKKKNSNRTSHKEQKPTSWTHLVHTCRHLPHITLIIINPILKQPKKLPTPPHRTNPPPTPTTPHSIPSDQTQTTSPPLQTTKPQDKQTTKKVAQVQWGMVKQWQE